jgi:hypothetical protein
VLEIYKRYASGLLTGSAVRFETGLTLSQFIFKFFDRAVLNSRLLVFFPKTMSETGGLNSVPPWSYWEAREYLKKRNKSLGCIFLAKHQFIDDASHNHCTLHNENVSSELTAKPIDCTFLICDGIRNIQKPNPSETNLWFSLLDFYFPNSVERFNQLCPDIIE